MSSFATFSGRRAMSSATSRSSVKVQASSAVPTQFKSIKPMGDRVLVKVDKAEARTIGGLLLPSSEQQQSTGGKIISLGEAQSVKVGERVVYSKFAGTEIDVSGENHVLLKEDDLIGKLNAGEKIAKLQPLQDRILIKKAKAAEKSAGGVLLSSESSEKPTFGVVVAVGDGKKKEDSEEVVKPNVKTGETVLYSKYSGSEFEEGDDSYVVVRESDILAVLA